MACGGSKHHTPCEGRAKRVQYGVSADRWLAGERECWGRKTSAGVESHSNSCASGGGGGVIVGTVMAYEREHRVSWIGICMAPEGLERCSSSTPL